MSKLFKRDSKAVRQHKKQLRHKAEMKFVALGYIVALGGITIAVSIAQVPSLASMNDTVQALVYGIISAPFFVLLYAYLGYWSTIANAIELTPQQYPELYKMYKEAAARIGIEELPRIFMINSNGELNAFASKRNLSKRYIVVHSDLIDIYNELGQNYDDVLRFILAHELAHVYLGHVNIRRSIADAALRPMFLSSTLSRAQEYSADRVAASITDTNNRAELILPLFAGKRQFQHTSVEAYLAHDVQERSRFRIKLANFLSTHPVGRRRIATLNRMDKEGWQHVHGKML